MNKLDTTGQLISVVVPCYNAEKYLARCLDSLTKQTYINIEIICVNDGSIDNTLQIIDSYAAVDSRIVVIDKENAGVSQARNKGLSHVRGDYIMFVDADDWIELNTCEIVYEVALDDACDLVMWTCIREFTDNSLPKKIFAGKQHFDANECRQKLYKRMIGPDEDLLKCPEQVEALCTVWGKLYRTDIIKKHNIVFEDIREFGSYEDGIFNMHYFEHVQSAVFLERYLYHYRKNNSSSLTTLYRPTLFAQFLKQFNFVKTYISKTGLTDDYKMALNNRVALSILGLGLNICQSNKKHIEKIKELKQILQHESYRLSYKQFKVEYLPLHWKLFYGFAKCNYAIGVYILLCVIKKLIGKWK